MIDAESSDKTVQLAREFTDRVWVRPWPGFAVQKNFALDQATGDWILSLDADERVTPELAERIKAIVAADGPADGYLIPRRNMFWGAWVRHGGLYPDYQLRLFRRGAGRFVEDAVHESVRVAGRVETLGEALLHQSYRDLEDFVRRSNRYSTLAAQDWLRRGRRRRRARASIMKPLGASSPCTSCPQRLPRRLAGARPAPSCTLNTCSCAWPRPGRRGARPARSTHAE